MLDLEAMRARSRHHQDRKPFKTNLTPEALARLQAASDYTGMFIYEIVEELVLTGLPDVQQIDQ